MTEPIFLGYPISTLFLYFIFYSFCGWVWETCYCSLKERHYVPRGFLYGPICPIYGVGVLLMILFFAPLQENLLVFYFVAVSIMTVSNIGITAISPLTLKAEFAFLPACCGVYYPM